MQMTLKQSKLAMDLASANCICSCNVTFSLLTPSGTDLTWRMTCTPHQNCLFSVLRFSSRVTVWSGLYTGVFKGRGQKGAAGRMEERKITPACGQQHRLELTPEQSDLFLAGGDDLRGRKWKLVPLNFTLITGCWETSSSCLAPVSAVQRISLKGAGLSCDGGMLHQQSQKLDHHATALETAAIKARKDNSM